MYEISGGISENILDAAEFFVSFADAIGEEFADNVNSFAEDIELRLLPKPDERDNRLNL